MQRIPVCSPAVICDRDEACQQCTITSINANGMLLLADNTHLEADCYTTVELALECEDGVKYQSETVRVVHCSSKQVAVAFVDFSSSHLCAFQRLLHSSHRAKHAIQDNTPQPGSIVHIHRYS